MSLNLVSRRLGLFPLARLLDWPALRLVALLGLGLAGCSTGDVVMMATIVGGEKIRVPLGRSGPALTNEAGVQINAAAFTMNAEKKIVFVFGFTDSRKRPLRHVRVEDVSDEAAVAFVDRAQPKLSATGEWHDETEPFDLSEPRLNWMATVQNTLRVFRFTLTFSDGQTLLIHQGAFFPAGMKSSIRHAFGKNY